MGQQVVIKEGLSNKYLTFRIGPEKYGIPVLRVIEIIKAQDYKLTEIPTTPGYFKGVLVLRDKVFSVLDTRQIFNLGPMEINDNTCVIILETLKSEVVAFLVEQVEEVQDFSDSEIESAPLFNNGDKHFLKGMGKKSNDGKTEVTLILDIDNIISFI